MLLNCRRSSLLVLVVLFTFVTFAAAPEAWIPWVRVNIVDSLTRTGYFGDFAHAAVDRRPSVLDREPIQI